MSTIGELLNRLCPNGVKFLTLGELGNFYGGITGKTKDDFVNGNATFISYKNVYMNPALDISPCDKVRIGENENQRMLQYGDVIFTGSSETPDECGISSVVTEKTKDPLYLNSFCFFFRFNDLSGIDPNFMKHLFRSSNLRYQIGRTASGVTRYNVSKKRMGKVVIPVPPLEVQHEIAELLDNFMSLTADLTAELTSELTARKKQYDYYKNKLFDFSNENISYKSVGELFDIRNGLNKEKAAFGHGKPIINFSDVYNNRWLDDEKIKGLVDVNNDEINRFSAKKGDVFFTRTSETKDDVGMSSTLVSDIQDCVFSGFVLRARPKTDLLLPKFCAYFFSTKEVRKTIVRYAAVTTRATTTGPKLSKIMVPIIDKKRQQIIVDILDQFDFLCNEISESIPVEVDARKTQYEYYRDKLLTFEKAI